jgi:biotin carboxyl carrier protein
MQITVNSIHTFDLAEHVEALDITQNLDGSFHLLHADQSYNIIPLEVDIQSKKIRIDINGKEFIMKIEDQFDLLIKKLGFSLNVVHKVKEIKAPMPGLVLDIMIDAGDEVEEGTPLVILEAMKMENVIKSPGAGKVKSIHIKLKDAIEKGAIMIEME